MPIIVTDGLISCYSLKIVET